MQIYIAARYQDQARLLRERLVAAGHVSTASWLDDEAYVVPKDRELKPAIAQTDLREIELSDALVLMAQPKGDYSPGGRHVEFGYAMAKHKHVFLLGERENVFHYLPEVHVCADVDTLIEQLKSHQ